MRYLVRESLPRGRYRETYYATLEEAERQKAWCEKMKGKATVIDTCYLEAPLGKPDPLPQPKELNLVAKSDPTEITAHTGEGDHKWPID